MWMVSFIENSNGNRNIRIFSDSEFIQAKTYSINLINDQDIIGVSHVMLCAIHECLVSKDVQTDEDTIIELEDCDVMTTAYIDD